MRNGAADSTIYAVNVIPAHRQRMKAVRSYGFTPKGNRAGITGVRSSERLLLFCHPTLAPMLVGVSTAAAWVIRLTVGSGLKQRQGVAKLAHLTEWLAGLVAPEGKRVKADLGMARSVHQRRSLHGKQ